MKNYKNITTILQKYYKKVAIELQKWYNRYVQRILCEVIRMKGIGILIYVLIFIIFALIAYAILQIRLFGMKVKDFWTFIEANQMLDKLYKFAKQYENMSPQEQVIYLSEAEKIFNAFDKVPDELWEEEYDKYKEVLTKYKVQF